MSNELVSRAECIETSKVIREWFAHHLPELREATGHDGIIEITGSRREGVDLAYPKSDLDFAIVAPTLTDLALISDNLLRSHDQGRIYRDLIIERKFTRAGLPWCPIEGFTDTFVDKDGKTVTIGPIRLDITFRLTDIHWLIQNHVEKAMTEKFKGDIGAIEKYINEMRILSETDMAEYNVRKDWLRVLPSKN